MEPPLPTAEEVTRETIARWLKVPDDGELVCETHGWDRPNRRPDPASGYPGHASAWLAFVADEGCGLGILYLVALPILGVLWLVDVVGLWHRPIVPQPEQGSRWHTKVVATPDGLTIGGDESYELVWGDIEALERLSLRAGAVWAVAAGPHRFRIGAHARNAAQIVYAIERVLAAKEAGRRLWDPASLPEGALSPAEEPETPLVERGLSRPEHNDSG